MAGEDIKVGIRVGVTPEGVPETTRDLERLRDAVADAGALGGGETELLGGRLNAVRDAAREAERLVSGFERAGDPVQQLVDKIPEVGRALEELKRVPFGEKMSEQIRGVIGDLDRMGAEFEDFGLRYDKTTRRMVGVSGGAYAVSAEAMPHEAAAFNKKLLGAIDGLTEASEEEVDSEKTQLSFWTKFSKQFTPGRLALSAGLPLATGLATAMMTGSQFGAAPLMAAMGGGVGAVTGVGGRVVGGTLKAVGEGINIPVVGGIISAVGGVAEGVATAVGSLIGPMFGMVGSAMESGTQAWLGFSRHEAMTEALGGPGAGGRIAGLATEYGYGYDKTPGFMRQWLMTTGALEGVGAGLGEARAYGLDPAMVLKLGGLQRMGGGARDFGSMLRGARYGFGMTGMGPGYYGAYLQQTMGLGEMFGGATDVIDVNTLLGLQAGFGTLGEAYTGARGLGVMGAVHAGMAAPVDARSRILQLQAYGLGGGTSYWEAMKRQEKGLAGPGNLEAVFGRFQEIYGGAPEEMQYLAFKKMFPGLRGEQVEKVFGAMASGDFAAAAEAAATGEAAAPEYKKMISAGEEWVNKVKAQQILIGEMTSEIVLEIAEARLKMVKEMVKIVSGPDGLGNVLVDFTDMLTKNMESLMKLSSAGVRMADWAVKKVEEGPGAATSGAGFVAGEYNTLITSVERAVTTGVLKAYNMLGGEMQATFPTGEDAGLFFEKGEIQ